VLPDEWHSEAALSGGAETSAELLRQSELLRQCRYNRTSLVGHLPQQRLLLGKSLRVRYGTSLGCLRQSTRAPQVLVLLATLLFLACYEYLLLCQYS
jgi:hypothetical protein